MQCRILRDGGIHLPLNPFIILLRANCRIVAAFEIGERFLMRENSPLSTRMRIDDLAFAFRGEDMANAPDGFVGMTLFGLPRSPEIWFPIVMRAASTDRAPDQAAIAEADSRDIAEAAGYIGRRAFIDAVRRVQQERAARPRAPGSTLRAYGTVLISASSSAWITAPTSISRPSAKTVWPRK